jgi:hypothetical protein
MQCTSISGVREPPGPWYALSSVQSVEDVLWEAHIFCCFYNTYVLKTLIIIKFLFLDPMKTEIIFIFERWYATLQYRNPLYSYVKFQKHKIIFDLFDSSSNR